MPAIFADARRGPPAGITAPWWAAWLETALDRCPGPVTERLAEGATERIGRVLARVCGPVAEAAATECSALRASGPDLEVGQAPSVLDGLAAALTLELAELCLPALSLELEAASALKGPAGLDDAMEGLAEPGAGRAPILRCAALARLVAERAQSAARAWAEALDRLARDLPDLGHLLDDVDPGPLVQAKPLGDSHEGGRCVLGLRFERGARLAYKPRDLRVDASLGRLLTTLDERGLSPCPGVPPVTCRDGYGWQRWIVRADIDDPHDASEYFGRLGALLAILHALAAIDMHSGNIIAAGTHPVLVDAETVLHPRLGGRTADRVDPIASELGLGSVLRVGLLPRASSFGVDLSGMGGDPAVEQWVTAPAWSMSADSAPRRERRETPLAPGDNVVRIAGRPVGAHEHLESVLEGFAAAHRSLRELARRGAADGMLDGLRATPVRVLLRSTHTYVQVLRESVTALHALDDGLGREQVLNALWRAVGDRPDLAAVAAAETQDLLAGDVPRFTGLPGDDNLRHHAHGTLEAALAPFRIPGLELLSTLDEADAARQSTHIRAAVLGASPARPKPTSVAIEGSVEPGREHALQHARGIARWLAVLAHGEGGVVTWLGPVAVPGYRERLVRAVDAGLADGQAGLALSVAAVADATDDQELTTLAGAALHHFLNLLHDGPPPSDLGMWSGAGGQLWALAHLAARASDRAAAALRPLVEATAPGVQDAPLGFGDGLAGYAIGLSAALAVAPDCQRARSAAQRTVERLAAEPGTPTGLDRAAAALALARLGDGLSRPELRDVAVEFLAATPPMNGATWAHGAPGWAVVAAELGTRSSPALREQVRSVFVALPATSADDTLATGAPGVLLAARHVAQMLDDRRLEGAARRRLAGALVEPTRRLAARRGDGLEGPGLLTGTAGLAWAWLALAGDAADELVGWSLPAGEGHS